MFLTPSGSLSYFLRRGLKSVEELKARVMAEKASAKLATNASATPPPASPIEERDAKVAAQIRARAEAEAKRKLSSGELSGGKSAIKVGCRALDFNPQQWY